MNCMVENLIDRKKMPVEEVAQDDRNPRSY